MDTLEFLKTRTAGTIHDALGITIEEAAADRVVLTMPVDERTFQYSRLLHGGASVVLAESAASIGAALNTDLARYVPVGVEINANHLRPVAKGRVTAEARPIHTGRQMAVWGVEIRDERGKLACIVRCTLAYKPGAMPGSDGAEQSVE